jgi:hypothetical protein
MDVTRSMILTRRKMLGLSAAGAGALGARLIWPQEMAQAPPVSSSQAVLHTGSSEGHFYAGLLQTWCDALLAHQVTGFADSALNGGFLCAACGLVHGRCGDAVYPLLRMAHTSGKEKYLRAALAVHAWSERNVSRPDGSWVNDVSVGSWQGITVFHAIAMAESLAHHGQLLDAATRAQWTDRLARAAKFLDGFITIETGNVNYPVTASLAFLLCGQALHDTHYLDRAHDLAHQSLAQFTPSGILFGEGHPLRGISPKGCRPVDLGYNVEESLPALTLYAKIAGDKAVLEQAVTAWRTHIEFMLPDGAWDNSWGTRNYKWSWWGSRTSDGCHPGLMLLADRDPSFREAARRNLELMMACTHGGVLYGGPDYQAHGYPACIHHTFTHAKSLATVLDRVRFEALGIAERGSLPRDGAYGLKTFAEIGTRLAAIGPWRATVTEYDWEYAEHVQAGSGGGGGHVTGGAMSLLFHRALGPVLTASMSAYQMIEIANQQAYRDDTHMELTPRIECVSGNETYSSVNDFAAAVTAEERGGTIVFSAQGRMLTPARRAPRSGEVAYRLAYTLSEESVEFTASATGAAPGPLHFLLPVVARATDHVAQPDPQTVRITRPAGSLTFRTFAPAAFEPVPAERTFNLVPGFEAAPIALALTPGIDVRVRLETAAHGIRTGEASTS